MVRVCKGEFVQVVDVCDTKVERSSENNDFRRGVRQEMKWDQA